MNVLKTLIAFCLVFIEGLESRIQTNTAELVSWLIGGIIFSVFYCFVMIFIPGNLLVVSTTTDCEDRFLVITDTSVTCLLSSQETLYN